MEDLKERFASGRRVLAAFRELSGLATPTALERDAAIKRFEYSFDIAWKACRDWLLTIEGVDQRTPKGVIRTARVAGLLSDEQTVAALEMANDRLLASHAYSEALAGELFGRLDGYGALLQAWLTAMAARMGES